jgi:hypothetical protein
MSAALTAAAAGSRKFKRATSGQTITNVLYDLYGTDTENRGVIPFAVNWPEAPSTSTNLTVSNNTELATALATPNAEITVAAGSYNALNIAADDQEWIVDAGATFAGLAGNGFDRVRVTGGNVVTAGDVNPYDFGSLTLRNVNIECDDFNIGLGLLLFDRCAVIHCTVFAQRTGLFVPGATANDAGVWAGDLIACANYVSGGMTVGNSGVESAFRIQSVLRTILVDNVARCGFDGQGVKHTYRSHYGNQNFWMRRNLDEYGDGIYLQARANNDAVVANNRMGNHYVFDSRIHTTNLSAFAFRGAGGGSIAADWTGALVTDGNQGFTDDTVHDVWTWAAKAGDSIGTDSINAYQAPPALSAFLAADGLPPGADH